MLKTFFGEIDFFDADFTLRTNEAEGVRTIDSPPCSILLTYGPEPCKLGHHWRLAIFG